MIERWVLVAALACTVTLAPAFAHQRTADGVTHARGTFDVKLAQLPAYDTAGGADVGRMSIDKRHHGDLAGLTGTMTMTIADGEHSYDFRFTLPDRAPARE